MSFSYLKQLPTPEEIKQTYPLSESCQKIKQKRDAEIARVLRGESDKFLVIIGPCFCRQGRTCHGLYSQTCKSQ